MQFKVIKKKKTKPGYAFANECQGFGSDVKQTKKLSSASIQKQGFFYP